MTKTHILANAVATVSLISCAGCTAQELTAMRARTADVDRANVASAEPSTWPLAPPSTASDSSTSPVIPTLPAGPALDPTNGHLLIPIGPGTYSDPTNGMLYPPGIAIPTVTTPQ